MKKSMCKSTPLSIVESYERAIETQKNLIEILKAHAERTQEHIRSSEARVAFLSKKKAELERMFAG